MDFRDFHSTAEVITENDERGSVRVEGINLRKILDIPKDEETLGNLERGKRFFSQGCLISRSN